MLPEWGDEPVVAQEFAANDGFDIKVWVIGSGPVRGPAAQRAGVQRQELRRAPGPRRAPGGVDRAPRGTPERPWASSSTASTC